MAYRSHYLGTVQACYTVSAVYALSYMCCLPCTAANVHAAFLADIARLEYPLLKSL